MAVYYIGRDMFDNMISCPRLYADVRHTLQLDLAGLTDSGQYALFSFIHACIHSFVHSFIHSFTPSLEVRLYVSLSMVFKRKLQGCPVHARLPKSTIKGMLQATKNSTRNCRKKSRYIQFLVFSVFNLKGSLFLPQSSHSTSACRNSGAAKRIHSPMTVLHWPNYSDPTAMLQNKH